MTKAIFLDRDGTINEEVDYLRRMEDIRIYPEAAPALAKFKQMGFLNIVITNQSGVARGYLTESELSCIHSEIIDRLTIDKQVLIDDIFYSPFHADGVIQEFAVSSDDRKPGIGMIQKAQRKFDIDLKESFLIGDSFTDMKCAENSGLRKIMVKTGYGERDFEKCISENITINHFAKNLLDAYEYIESLHLLKV